MENTQTHRYFTDNVQEIIETVQRHDDVTEAKQET